MNYYIFRHAETYFSNLDIPYGEQIESAEILLEGIPATQKLSEKLESIQTDVNYTSPYKRCLQTVEIVNKYTGKEFLVDERLHDYNAESVPEMFDRLSKFYDDLRSKNYKSVAICTHGYPIVVLQSLITKVKFTQKDLDSYPRTGTLLIIRDKKVELLDFN